MNAMAVPARTSTRAKQEEALPKSWPPLARFFGRYARRYLRGHFHTVRVSREGGFPVWLRERTRVGKGFAPLPIVIYGNHSSWWDPLIGLFVVQAFLPGYELFAPIDAQALDRYRVLRHLGFFGVEQGSRRGAASFLRVSSELLRKPATVLCLTPQGRFVDPRERPVKFKPGLGHLANHLEKACYLPVAVEYPFWEERTPEALIRFGDPVIVEKGRTFWSADEWTEQFEQGLAFAQDALALESQQRQRDAFEILLGGKAGVGGIYDAWRTLAARLRGRRFRREHSDL